MGAVMKPELYFQPEVKQKKKAVEVLDRVCDLRPLAVPPES